MLVLVFVLFNRMFFVIVFASKTLWGALVCAVFVFRCFHFFGVFAMWSAATFVRFCESFGLPGRFYCQSLLEEERLSCFLFEF